jgi:hypothetical protein
VVITTPMCQVRVRLGCMCSCRCTQRRHHASSWANCVPLAPAKCWGAISQGGYIVSQVVATTPTCHVPTAYETWMHAPSPLHATTPPCLSMSQVCATSTSNMFESHFPRWVNVLWGGHHHTHVPSVYATWMRAPSPLHAKDAAMPLDETWWQAMPWYMCELCVPPSCQALYSAGFSNIKLVVARVTLRLN